MHHEAWTLDVRVQEQSDDMPIVLASHLKSFGPFDRTDEVLDACISLLARCFFVQETFNGK